MPRSRFHDKRLAETLRAALKTPIRSAPLVEHARCRLILAFLAANLERDYPNFVSAIRDALERMT